jgi:hypothetical protein
MRARSSSRRSVGIYRCCLRCDDQADQSSAVSLDVLVGLVVPQIVPTGTSMAPPMKTSMRPQCRAPPSAWHRHIQIERKGMS